MLEFWKGFARRLPREIIKICCSLIDLNFIKQKHENIFKRQKLKSALFSAYFVNSK